MKRRRVKHAPFPSAAREYLEEHGLLRAARILGIRYFTADETRERVGLPKDREPSDGIGVKLRQDGSEWSIRFLRDGAKPKFKQSFDSHNEFLLSPGEDWADIKKDVEQDVYFVEGWNSAFALCENGILAIGLNGVFGWRSDGDPLDEFEHTGWKWDGRKVRVCFDSDVLHNPNVQRALVRLCRYLHSLGANVFIRVIEGARNEKIGPADILLARGKDALSAIPELRLGEGYSREWAAPKYVRELNKELALFVQDGNVVLLRLAPDPEYPHLQKVSLMRTDAARDVYATHQVEITGANNKVKRVPVLPLWLANKGRRDVSALVMEADRPFGFDPITRTFNTWQGFAITPHPPDETHGWNLLKEHIRQVVCSGDEDAATYMLNSFAWAVQHPTEASGVVITMIGEEGVGKGIVADHLGVLFGNHYLTISDPEHLLGRFTAHLLGKVLVFLDEAMFAGNRAQRDRFYSRITGKKVNIEGKGRDLITIRNDKKYLLATNHDWAVPAGKKARRFFVVRVGEAHRNDFDYFKAIEDELKAGGYEAMLHDLLHMDLSGFEIRAIPKTTALWDQKRQSFDAITEWFYNGLRNGTFVSGSGWERVISCRSVEAMIGDLATSQQDKKSARTQIGIRLKQLCPAIENKLRRLDRGEKAVHCYIFPKLKACREAFAREMDQEVAWK